MKNAIEVRWFQDRSGSVSWSVCIHVHCIEQVKAAKLLGFIFEENFRLTFMSTTF